MYLGQIERWVEWPAGNMELLLSPLDDVDDQAILSACRTVEREMQPTDKPGQATGRVINRETDYVQRQQLIGQKCIRDWRGPGAPKDAITKQPLVCDDRAKAAFMRVRVAADFVIREVQGLSLYLEEETAAAGKG